MKTIFTKNNIIVCTILVCVTLCLFAPKGNNNIFKCGDGISLKELNEQKKANMRITALSLKYMKICIMRGRILQKEIHLIWNTIWSAVHSSMMITS